MHYSPLRTIAGSILTARLTGRILARNDTPIEIPIAIGIISKLGLINVLNTLNPINCDRTIPII